MPAKGGRPYTEKRAKRVFRRVQGDCPAGVWGGAPHTIPPAASSWQKENLDE